MMSKDKQTMQELIHLMLQNVHCQWMIQTHDASDASTSCFNKLLKLPSAFERELTRFGKGMLKAGRLKAPYYKAVLHLSRMVPQGRVRSICTGRQQVAGLAGQHTTQLDHEEDSLRAHLLRSHFCFVSIRGSCDPVTIMAGHLGTRWVLAVVNRGKGCRLGVMGWESSCRGSRLR